MYLRLQFGTGPRIEPHRVLLVPRLGVWLMRIEAISVRLVPVPPCRLSQVVSMGRAVAVQLPVRSLGEAIRRRVPPRPVTPALAEEVSCRRVFKGSFYPVVSYQLLA